MVCSKAAALRRENMISNDNSEKVCGICHDPAEDPAVSSSFWVLLFCFSGYSFIFIYPHTKVWKFGIKVGYNQHFFSLIL